MLDIPVPHLVTANTGPLQHVEETMLQKIATIEGWFRQQWQKTPAPVTSSVDIRNAGFKLAPVDTNLFPAGFNNLNSDFMPLCVQAAQSYFIEHYPDCTRILILPESHTRNLFYMQSLRVLQDIFVKAGFIVRIGSLDPNLTTPQYFCEDEKESVIIEPVLCDDGKLRLKDFKPCLLLLNNDLSSGMPQLLENIQQNIQPSPQLGWTIRFKSTHFHYFSKIADEFSEIIDIDPWLIRPNFCAVEGVDFMSQEGLEKIAEKVDLLLDDIAKRYKDYGITESPFVAVKADNGTYGMSVMMVKNGQTLLEMNRKQRTSMAVSKGSKKVSRVIIQEGVYTFETMPDGAVAEPVVYMIGQFVVGGFYRVHQSRKATDNLNSPGMHFEPLAFAEACNNPRYELEVTDSPNRFYVYGVIARLAALAAARERQGLQN